MADLPGGTVTFLFMDIEGSTRLLQELRREGYTRALVGHERLEALVRRGPRMGRGHAR
jgi:class 3 adenylate cyclase